MSLQATSHSPLATDSDEVLVRVEGVSKKFCRSLKRSLWYGICDIGAELNPFRRQAPEVAGSGLRVAGNGSNPDSSEPATSYSQPVTDEAGLRPGEFYAVRDVSFELRRGECLGLIGHNGAGKTTLLKMLNGLIKPDRGRIEMNGRVGALIALGAGFNPILTGRENIYINGSVLGLSKKEIDAKIDEIIDFAEIGEFIDTPVQNYSSGMTVRLGFAVATALNPDILVLDEVLAVGDVAFRTKCFQRIGHIIDKSCVIFVSHDPVQVSRICDLCLYMKRGQVVASGVTDEILELYRRDQPVRDLRNSQIIDPLVKKFNCSLATESCSWGDELAVRIHLELAKPIQFGLALIAVQEGETSVAQFEITQDLNLNHASCTDAVFRIGPVHLREGVYGISITILNESRKKTVVHSLNVVSFRVMGPKGYGVPYQLPVKGFLD